ncbi:MAG: hypothetical protein AAF599_06095 [Bacteroidota bacterium]
MKNIFIILGLLFTINLTTAQTRLIDHLQAQGLKTDLYCIYEQLDTNHTTGLFRYPTLGKPGFPKDLNNAHLVPMQKFEIWYAPRAGNRFKSSGSGYVRGFSFSMPFRHGDGIYAVFFPEINAVLMVHRRAKGITTQLYYYCPPKL